MTELLRFGIHLANWKTYLIYELNPAKSAIIDNIYLFGVN